MLTLTNVPRASLSWIAMIGLLAWLPPAQAEEPSTEDFKVVEMDDLIVLCSAPESHQLHEEAISFCHGYVVGAYQFYQAIFESEKRTPLVCLPEPKPSRAQAIQEFVVWARAHPEYNKEKPVEALFKFLTERYPCPQDASGQGGKNQ